MLCRIIAMSRCSPIFIAVFSVFCSHASMLAFLLLIGVLSILIFISQARVDPSTPHPYPTVCEAAFAFCRLDSM